MTKNKKVKNSRILRNGAIIFLCLIGILIIGCVFINFSENLEDELNNSSSESIEETYKEVGQLITSISQSRINYLEMLGDYLDISELTDDDEIISTIEHYRELCGFTQFYFLNSNGRFMTIDKIDGYIDLGRDISALDDDSTRNLIVDGSLPSRDEMIFYIANVNDGVYNGFHYSAISFGYDKQDMINSLKIDAYNGEGITYLTYNTGKIICRLDETTRASNVFTILEYSTISDKEKENIIKDFKAELTNTYKISGNGEENFTEDYYFSYQPLKYQDWILVSMVPVNIANLSANQIRQQTTNIIIGAFSAIFIFLTIGLIFVFRDAIKNRDGMLLQRNMVFDLACNNLDEIYVLFNVKNKYIEYVSPNVERLLDMPNDDVYENGRYINIKLKDNTYSLLDIINDFVDRDVYEFSDDIYVKSPNMKKEVLYSLNLFRQVNSLFGVAVLSDRTKENAIRQELQDALDGAKQANEAKTAFLSSVSHDMRTPMNAIIGFANLLEKDPKDANKVMEYISKIKLSSNHLLNLINEVLDFSKIESGKTTLNLKANSIETIVNSIDSIIRPQAIEKGLSFNINKHLDKKCMVECDELRISQILINVLSNSIKYTEKGGTVNFDITSKKFHQYMQYTFVVADNGVGMSPEFVKKIFEPFSREETSTINKIQGTGLGMSITKNLVDLMGGNITVESKKGEGSKFTIVLAFTPANDEELTSKLDLKEMDEDYSIAGLNILGAEDNLLNSEIIKAILESEGAKIVLTENGKECLERFENSEENEFDLILMDVQMPIMDGYEATMRIRNCNHPRAKTIPIIAMTANAFLEDVENSKKAGMDGHVSKPIDIKVLKSTIKNCLNNNK